MRHSTHRELHARHSTSQPSSCTIGRVESWCTSPHLQVLDMGLTGSTSARHLSADHIDYRRYYYTLV
jgi:hypothetical protein